MELQLRRRCIGLDVHREFAQVAIWQSGVVTQAGRFATTPEGVRAFAEGLGPADEVALEATGNTWAIATLLASRAGRVVVSNPVKTRAIAEAKVKTDKVDAEILAQLLAADYRSRRLVVRRDRSRPRRRRSDPNRSTLSTLKITPWASPLDIIELQSSPPDPASPTKGEPGDRMSRWRGRGTVAAVA